MPLEVETGQCPSSVCDYQLDVEDDVLDIVSTRRRYVCWKRILVNVPWILRLFTPKQVF